MTIKKTVPMAALLGLAGCVSTPPVPQPTPGGPVFDPIAFFTGRTEGHATLHKIFSAPHAVRVEGRGHVTADGVLVLNQKVFKDGKKPTNREWRIHKVAPGRYTGTLTDAKGPVEADVSGNRLHIRFTMKGGFPTQQWLTLAPDGQSADNIMQVRKLGLTVASLHETIRRLPDTTP